MLDHDPMVRGNKGERECELRDLGGGGNLG